MVLSFVILVVTAIALGSVGIYFSAVMQRTLTASIMTYGFALFVTLGLPLIVFVIMSLFGPLFYNMASPPIPLQAALYYGLGALVVTNPLATAMMTEMLLVNSQHAGFFMQTLTSGAQTAQIPLVSPWIVFTILYLAVSAILVTQAIRRVRRIEA